MKDINKPLGIPFMTDRNIELMRKFFSENETTSFDEIHNKFGLDPRRLKSLVLSSVLEEFEENGVRKYRPGKLWPFVKTFYRYGSIDETSKNIKKLAWKTLDDWDRAFLFQPGDVVTQAYIGDAPGTTGVVIEVNPKIRKVLVMWSYGRTLHDANELNLMVRDNGSRQINVPVIEKDILDEYIPNEFIFNKDQYSINKDKYKRYKLIPQDNVVVIEDEEDEDKSKKKKKSSQEQLSDNSNLKVEVKGNLSKLKLGSNSLKRIATSFMKKGPDLNIEEDINSNYILTQSEIIVSVNTEEGNPLYKDTPWYITPDTAQNVNDNGDAWSNQVIANTYKSFRGSYNFYEHNQDIKESKGRVLDSILRKVPLSGDRHYYAVEILVATNRKHKNLVSRIESGSLNTLSMGCSAIYTQCSKCGHIVHGANDRCSHLMFQKGEYFYDEHGNKRIIAELCGVSSVPDSVEFEEASFVEVPAWKNAKVHGVISNQTNLINVVGYLSTRLHAKDSIEFILSNGTLKSYDLNVDKVVKNSDLSFNDSDNNFVNKRNKNVVNNSLMNNYSIKSNESDPFGMGDGMGDEIGSEEVDDTLIIEDNTTSYETESDVDEVIFNYLNEDNIVGR